MKLLDLFSGIGGFSLAARWMGWETVAFCERDPFCQKVLRKHWPTTLIYDDIHTLPAKFIRDAFQPDIITGGFPCQPFSQAGKRAGKDDDRYLWPAMLEVIATVRPRFVVGENVAGLITMGLDTVLSDLESEGYTCQAVVIPACATGAPHRRDRVWIIAHAEHERRNDWRSDERGRNDYANGRIATTGRVGNERRLCADDADGTRLQERAAIRRSERQALGAFAGKDLAGCNARHATSERLPDWAGGTMGQPSPLTEFERSDSDGKEREIERYVCRVDDGFSEWMARPVRDRVNKLKALGNAIVPQIAYQIFQAIEVANYE